MQPLTSRLRRRLLATEGAMTAESVLAQILELQERHLRLIERLHAREIDAGRFKTELTRLRRETERLRQRVGEGARHPSSSAA